MIQGRCKASLVQVRSRGRGLVCLPRQGHHGRITRLDAPIRTAHVEHAALKGFNSSDGTRAHYPINHERALRWLHVAVEEFLDQTDIVCAIEATVTDGGHNGLHLKFLSMLCCGADVVTSVAGPGQHRVAQPQRHRRCLALACCSSCCYNACTNVSYRLWQPREDTGCIIMEAIPWSQKQTCCLCYA